MKHHSVHEQECPVSSGKNSRGGRVFRRTLLFAVLFLEGTLAYGAHETKSGFETYKKEMLRDLSLIRYYTFEEASPWEVANHTTVEAGKRAFSGGPLGSLRILTDTPYGKNCLTERSRNDRNYVSPEWTRGRWPWKPALSLGTGETTLYRSGIDGSEFSKGGTFFGWFRIHETVAPQAAVHLIYLNRSLMLDWRKQGESGTLTVILDNRGTPPDRLRAVLQGQNLKPGIWNFFAVSLDGKNASLHLNGTLAVRKPFAGSLKPVPKSSYIGNAAYYHHGERLRIGCRLDPKEHLIPADICEFGIYNRALKDTEIQRLYSLGKPSESPAAQLADFRRENAAKEKRKKIRLEIPAKTAGYFRINAPVPVTAEIPADSGFQGEFRFTVSVENLNGKVLWSKERKLIAGTQVVENLRFDKCGVYYLSLSVRDAKGRLVRELPEKYSVGIVPPAPASNTAPVAFWWNQDDYKFSYDAPIRRMNYWGDAKGFLEWHDALKKAIPHFKAYVMMGCPTQHGKKLTDEQKKEYEAYCEKAADVFASRNIWGFEATSEVYERCISQEAYFDLLPIMNKVFRKKVPNMLIVPPGGQPPTIPQITYLLKKGGAEYIDGVSHHNYKNNPVAEFHFDNCGTRLQKAVDQYAKGKKLILWDSESALGPLPRIGYRPMTREEAFSMKYPRVTSHGYTTFMVSIPLVPEEEAAALQVHAILTDLISGYSLYCRCNGPGDVPNLQGVAITALCGQILNKWESCENLKLDTLNTLCVLVKNSDKTCHAAIFGMEERLLNFRLKPNTAYRTMDLFGNYGSIRTDADGILSVNSGMNPFYILNIPDDMKQVSVMKLSIPEKLSDRGFLRAKLDIANPFSTTLRGRLEALPLKGAKIKLSKTDVSLAEGKRDSVDIELNAFALKRRSYPLEIMLKDRNGRSIASAQSLFHSAGLVHEVQEFRRPVRLDGDETKWKQVKEFVYDDAESVVHGKPNLAEQWLPQWRGKKDLSLSVKVAWRRNDAVYFLLKVTDDCVLPAPPNKVSVGFLYDCLELFFDSRPVGELGSALDQGADQVVIIPNSGNTAGACRLWYASRKNNFFSVACIGGKTHDGYWIEGRITPEKESRLKILPGTRFNMDFLVDDADIFEGKTLLRKSAMAVHGDFNNNSNADKWGAYELSLDNPVE